ncbi:hypothetical protein SETIT_2G019300v2 [Setaria italica]|uniref:Uncharacterized protein n=2 Tax=Setaria italica TaxID=4555 RepID=A0A368PU65_SETIT|nr:hypothetical protein SETIT_2G019300v2 [Setaria italica]
MSPPRPPPELIDDVVTEILLRLPPGEPRHLFRASLVCKLWRRLLTDAAFLRQYRRFHRTPPLLGFFSRSGCDGAIPRFVPTTAASPFPRPVFDCHPWSAIDCRHGRVLLQKMQGGRNLTVWDPITGGRTELGGGDFMYRSLSAAVLCAAAGCHHDDCHGGPFLVVWIGRDSAEGPVHVSVYSSRVGSWGASISANVAVDDFINPSRGVLVGDAIFFMLTMSARILKYDLVKHHLSVIDPPAMYDKGIYLVPTEDNLLGIAGISGSSLYLWSRKANAEGVEGWVQCRVLELRTLLPVGNNPFTKAVVIGFAESTRVMFMFTDVGIFIIELNSGLAKKISEPEIYYPIVPFMSFYTPDCTSS